MTLGLTGQSFSASVGSISITDMTVGLTGQSATFSIGAVNIFAYGDVDTGQIHHIVMFQLDRMIHIRMLQLDQIQVIVTLHRR